MAALLRGARAAGPWHSRRPSGPNSTPRVGARRRGASPSASWSTSWSAHTPASAPIGSSRSTPSATARRSTTRGSSRNARQRCLIARSPLRSLNRVSLACHETQAPPARWPELAHLSTTGPHLPAEGRGEPASARRLAQRMVPRAPRTARSEHAPEHPIRSGLRVVGTPTASSHLHHELASSARLYRHENRNRRKVVADLNDVVALADGDHELRTELAEVAHDALELVVADAFELRDRGLVYAEPVCDLPLREAGRWREAFAPPERARVAGGSGEKRPRTPCSSLRECRDWRGARSFATGLHGLEAFVRPRDVRPVRHAAEGAPRGRRHAAAPGLVANTAMPYTCRGAHRC